MAFTFSMQPAARSHVAGKAPLSHGHVAAGTAPLSHGHHIAGKAPRMLSQGSCSASSTPTSHLFQDVVLMRLANYSSGATALLDMVHGHIEHVLKRIKEDKQIGQSHRMVVSLSEKLKGIIQKLEKHNENTYFRVGIHF